MVASASVYEEDEDVVIQGSTLHKHLCKVGYIDFETVPVNYMHIKRKTLPTFSDIVLVAKAVHKKLYFIYSWIMQEDAIAYSSLSTILRAEMLLDDHVAMIDNFLQLYSHQRWNYRLPSCILLCSTASALYMLLKQSHILTILCPTTLTYAIISIMRLQHYADNNLKHLVSLQNDLYSLCKKGLKILRSDFKFKTGLGQTPKQFHNLMSNRLCYLQPLMECVISYMENVTYLCYRTSLIITRLLPKHYCVDTLLTRFQYNLFTLRGGISYQSLKRLYNTHILVQSEMLQLVAIAYNANTWSESYCTIPQMKLNAVCQMISKHLLMYRDKLKGIIDKYYNSEVQLNKREYKGATGSKWQELYMQLDITAHKIELAYINILSVIKDIDTASKEVLIDDDRIEIIMTRINEVCKGLEAAKNFAELSNLMIARTRIVKYEKDNVRSIEMSDVNSDVPVVTDTEPEIVDEVFEEYIKEEYMKPLLEDGYELDLPKSKLDKLLLKTFMSELKDVLIDKHKSMCEREAKALQYRYKNILKNSQVNSKLDIDLSVPVPPPLPSWNICLSRGDYIPENINKFRDYENHKKDLHEESGQSTMSNGLHEDAKLEVKTLAFSLEHRPAQFLYNFPPPFMKVAEEVFAGSGENSEEEPTNVECEFDENTK